MASLFRYGSNLTAISSKAITRKVTVPATNFNEAGHYASLQNMVDDVLEATRGSVRDVLETTTNGIRSVHTTVIYSGPTDATRGQYDDNFEFLLRHGLPCSHTTGQAVPSHRFVFVLTNETKPKYEDRIRALNRSWCGNDLHIVTREPRCYDMESARVTLVDPDPNQYNPLSAVRSQYTVYVNCGVLGPLLPKKANATFWTSAYTNRINDQIKLVGLSLNCGGAGYGVLPHVQSMLWASDAEGLKTIQHSGAIYDCGDQPLPRGEARLKLIHRYELGLSRSTMQAGGSIASALPNQPKVFDLYNQIIKAPEWEWCKDLWYEEHYPKLERYLGTNGLLFYKVSRHFPPSVRQYAQQMNEKIRETPLWNFTITDVPNVSLVPLQT